ncbi:MAG TPA: adenylate/guanylate cyclase domain-containing protein, partial [Casimicrobiaceae bacterium]|nr:adenylate/guanylate cyclase domain-containing protein [Casimicrobiaceae bacterium]
MTIHVETTATQAAMGERRMPPLVHSSRSLEAYIPGDRRRALARGETLPDRVRGAALLADISGFTPMTEALANELGARRGAEELTRQLNRVFHALIEELDRFGGEVIYFSGDALTCWIDADDGLRATACALAMQRTMAGLAEVATPGGTVLRLAMKAAVAVGYARRFLVGDPDIQLIDALAGGIVDGLAAGEQLAKPGEVLLDAFALAALGDRVVIGETREDGQGRRYGVVDCLACEVPATPRISSNEPLPDEVVRRWLLPGIYERVAAGEADFVAELRSAYSLFASFGGIDYEEVTAAAKLDDFVRRTQRILVTYGGTLLHLTIGDKGAYLSAVFGPPFAHEDDAVRAAAAAIALRDVASVTDVDQLRIGLTYGRL